MIGDGRAYEVSLPRAARRETGVYYTPAPIADRLTHEALASLPGSLRGAHILDPACGAGVFLVSAFRFLRERLPGVAPVSLLAQLHGLDTDPTGVALANAALSAESGVTEVSVARRGDFLAGEPTPHVHAVIGNPPWGQKDVGLDRAAKDVLRARFPSSQGIFDWFRPFVEASVRSLHPGGICALVLPDILLLKNYEATRRFLLAELTIESIGHLGMVFPHAVIDAVTVVGRRAPAPPGHTVRATVEAQARAIPQEAFGRLPRATFNLHLTAESAARLDQLRGHPRLGDAFEVHEGVHSGNLRPALFVDGPVDDSCRPLLVRGNELVPYRITWGGSWLRASACPTKRTREAYANLGRADWHEQDKVLVRRTGDAVSAAVDLDGRWASNNYFVVVPRRRTRWTLDALAAFLNSAAITEHFRTIEPRRGRAFAEIKIKHLVDFPLPADPADLDELGAARRTAPAGVDRRLDAAIDERARQLLSRP